LLFSLKNILIIVHKLIANVVFNSKVSDLFML
jgi:hypothetical protein